MAPVSTVKLITKVKSVIANALMVLTTLMLMTFQSNPIYAHHSLKAQNVVERVTAKEIEN